MFKNKQKSSLKYHMLWNWQIFIFFFLVRRKTDLQIMGVAGSISSHSREELFMKVGEEGDFFGKRIFFSDWKRFLHCSMSIVQTQCHFFWFCSVEGKERHPSKEKRRDVMFFSLCSQFFLRLMNGNMTKVTDSNYGFRLEQSRYSTAELGLG